MKNKKGIPCSNMKEFDAVMEGSATEKPRRTPTPDIWWKGILKLGETIEGRKMICRAVNSHEELLGHLKVFKNYVGELLANGKGNGNEVKMYPLLEEAIAKAEGK